MSTIASWSYTQTLTLWRRGPKDQFGRYTYADPEYLLCSYRIGGSEQYTDSTGVAFTPKSIFWTELKGREYGEVGNFIAELESDLSIFSEFDWLSSSFSFYEKPNFGDKVQLGLNLGDPTGSAADIRSITIDDAAMFGLTEKPDYILGI